MERIELFTANGVWMARSNSAVIFELFETDTLPTAFTAKTPAAEVERRIQKLNPNAEVLVLDQVPYEETPYCSKCGEAFFSHNDDGSCV